MNYILLYPDEMRAESLHCYGHPLVKTPNIDRLAEEGTLFEQNYTQHPVCGPSRACLATGWYPHVDGRRTYYLLDKGMPNFFTYIREAGFTTCHAGKDDMFDREGMPAIFNEIVPFREGRAQHGVKPREIGHYTMLTEPVPEGTPNMDMRFTEGSIDFISRNAKEGKPFFLMLSWMAPHPAYSTFEKYDGLYDTEKLPPTRDQSWLEGKPELYKIIREYRNAGLNEDAIYRKINAVYLGMITFIDDQIGRIIAALEENGIYEDTTIILCSDHGDFAGDAGLVEKWPSAMDDMITRVPLIIRRPGGAKGHRVTTLTQSIDILPTICDYEGIEIKHDQFGVSLKPQIEGEPGDAGRAVYCEGGYDVREPHCFEPVCFANGRDVSGLMVKENHYYPKMLQQQERPESVCRVVMQRWKNWKLCVRTNGDNELYDMEKDPMEYYNLYSDSAYEKIRSELTLKALTWMTHTSDVVPRERHG